MKRIVSTFLEGLFGQAVIALAVTFNLPYFLVGFYCRRITEVMPDGSRRKPTSDRFDGVTVLFLSPDRFRGDPQVFAGVTNLRVLEIPTTWQTRLMAFFYPKKGISAVHLYRPDLHPGIAARQIRYRAFLKKFLPRLYGRLGVKCVIGADMRDIADIDWGVVSKSMGVPYMIFHRECMVQAGIVREHVVLRLSRWGPFPGTKIVVHNEDAKDVIIESGFATADDILVLGCARMNPFINRVRKPLPKRLRPLVVLFTFESYQYSQTARRYPLSVFVGAHVAVARVAEKYPDVDVIIKPKPSYLKKGPWVDHMSQAWRDANIDLNALPNLTIEPEANAHELIMKATVVCGIDSTTVLEAGLARVPVIVPFFNEIRGEEFVERVNFRDDLEAAFDTPRDWNEMVLMIEDRLRSGGVNGNHVQLDRQRMLFEKFVARLDHDPLELSVNAIFKAVSHATEHIAESPGTSEETIPGP